MSQLLMSVRLDFRKLAKLSGVSLGYIRLLSSRHREPGPQAREKLAKGLRTHAKELEAAAAKLEQGDG